MKKKRKKILLIILAVFAILVAVVFYFLPVRLLIHTFANNDGEMTEVRFDDTIRFVMNGNYMKFRWSEAVGSGGFAIRLVGI